MRLLWEIITRVTEVRRDEKEKVAHTCQRICVATNMTTHRQEKKQKEKRKKYKKTEQSSFNSEQKESPQTAGLSTTVLCLKCRVYVQKYSCAGLTAPKAKENQQRKGTNSGEESNESKARIFRMRRGCEP